MNQNPFGNWTRSRKIRWVVLSLLLGFLFGPRFVHALIPPRMQLIDFYQEWSSAKNIVEGLPTYAPLEDTVERYLGVKKPEGVDWYWDVNVHPPTSVLLALPLQGLDFASAFICWGIASLMALVAAIVMVVRQLRLQFSAWNLVPLISLALVCDPLYQQVVQGQLNLVLLLMIVGIWVADRNERPVAAGCLLALAAAVKLFPAFLGIYFLLQRKWRAVATSAVAFVLLTLATAPVTGVETYETYVGEIVPQAATWKSAWNNASLAGFWHKIFDPGSRSERFIEPFHYPLVAKLGTLVSWAVVLATLAAMTWVANSRRQRDVAFGLAIVAMLLISPVTWEHYFLLLLLPLTLVWVELPSGRLPRWLLGSVLAVLFLPIIMLCNILIPGGFFEGKASLGTTLTLLSCQFYALCLLYAGGLLTFQRIRSEESASSVVRTGDVATSTESRAEPRVPVGS